MISDRLNSVSISLQSFSKHTSSPVYQGSACKTNTGVGDDEQQTKQIEKRGADDEKTRGEYLYMQSCKMKGLSEVEDELLGTSALCTE